MTVRRLLLVPLAAAAAIAGFTWLDTGRRSAEAPVAAAKISGRYAGFDATRALAESDATISALEARIATPYGDMIDRESLSIAWMKRSKLSGDFGHLVKAREAADAGIAMSPPGTGPWLAKAAAEFSAHRIAESALALDRVDKFVVPDDATRAESKAMRGDIAMARGDYAGAAREFAAAESLDRWPGLLFRKAVLARFTGDLDTARTLFAQADALDRDPTPLFRADMLLRQGELDFAQGKWAEASARYAAAARAFPGYWRADMRVAQMAAIAGRTRPALATFERIANTTGNPDAMYVSAGLNRDLGNEAAAQGWIAKADRAWATRLALLPEAAWGHAVEHELAFGDPRMALKLAGKNAKNRPHGIPLLLLAEAWILNGRADLALALCRRVEASGWVSADQWVIRAVALDKLGRTKEAEDARAKALRINPREYDKNAALAWFHD